MNGKPPPNLLTALIAVAVLLCVPASYVGGYYALVRPGMSLDNYTLPEYRGGLSGAPRFFKPMHRVDRWLRPHYWTAPERLLRISLVPQIHESQFADGR